MKESVIDSGVAVQGTIESMKTIFPLFLSLSLWAPVSEAQSLRGFLKNCAWGTVAGAGVGVVSLAFEDQPGDSWNNVARGASLGLYAGIAYGIYDMNREPAKYHHPEFSLAPKFDQGRIDGVQFVGTLFQF